MNDTTLAAVGGAVLVVLLLFIRWRWKKILKPEKKQEERPIIPSTPLVHRLCPHHNVIQSFTVEQKDSLDEHLDVLTRKLAEKEGRLRLSKSKIRETQNEIENLQAIDLDVRARYREIMENLKSDLLSNEKECKKLQDQIEWVSQRRAELREESELLANQREFKQLQIQIQWVLRRRAQLREEVRYGQRLYGEAAAELASNLADLQRGRAPNVTDKPLGQYSNTSLRPRKEPLLPRASPVSSLVIKTPPDSPSDPAHHRTHARDSCTHRRRDQLDRSFVQ